MAAREEGHRLAVDQGVVGRQPADRRRDLQKPGGEICPVSAPNLDALALIERESSGRRWGRGAGSYAKRQRRQAGRAGRHERQPVGA